MGRWLALVPLVSLFGLASCAFLLDFDELSGGGDPDAGIGATGGSGGTTAGSGGASGSGGSSGSSGNDGGGQCAENCADTDPCTNDRCDGTASPPRCVHEPITALVKDGVSETLTADEMHRVTMTSGPDAFYYSVFEQTNMSPEVTLYRLGGSAAASQELVKVSSIPFIGQARSAGGLVVDTSQGFQLHAFPAFGNDVFHIIFNETFMPGTPPRIAIGTYDMTIPRRYPVAMKLANGEIVGAWINNDGTVSVGSATRTATVLSPTGVRVSQITPLASNNTPGVLWTSPSGVNAQLLGGTPAPITTCNNQLGVFLSATTTEVLPGFWVASWTKAGDGYLVTEGKGLGCSATTCVSNPACEMDKQLTPGLRNPAITTAARAGDPPGTVFLASATPLLGPSPDGASVTSAIALTVSKMVIQGMNLEAMTENIGTVELSRMAPIGAEYEGPDWPAVSILPPDKVAVAWLEPNAPSGDKLRLERYRICAP